LQGLFARLDHGQIEKIVHQRQQMFAARAYVVDVFLVTLIAQRSEILLLEDIGEAENRVQRRAEFMRNIGEETALLAPGEFGCLAFVPQRKLQRFVRFGVTR
jgi:hypothetical protein